MRFPERLRFFRLLRQSAQAIRLHKEAPLDLQEGGPPENRLAHLEAYVRLAPDAKRCEPFGGPGSPWTLGHPDHHALRSYQPGGP